MRVSAGLALLLAASALRAQDVGTPVTFHSRSSSRFLAQAVQNPSRILYDSGASDVIDGEWDTVLIQGMLPDPAVRFFALRPGGSPAWVEFKVKRFAGGRFWGKASFPRGKGGLRLRAVDAGLPRSSQEVLLYSIEVFVDGPVSEPASAAASRGEMNPAAEAPFVRARDEWGAAQPKEPYSPDPLPWRITLHHTAGRYTTNLSESLAETRFIQDFHQNGRGWNDIAYHYVVDSLGNIFEGRPLEALGAHTLHNNVGNVGIVLLGTYHEPQNNMPAPAQIEAVTTLGRYLVERFGIASETLRGHRDYRPTSCPGDHAYLRLDELRRALGPGPFYSIFRGGGAINWDGQRVKNNAATPSATR